MLEGESIFLNFLVLEMKTRMHQETTFLMIFLAKLTFFLAKDIFTPLTSTSNGATNISLFNIKKIHKTSNNILKEMTW